MDVAGKHHTHTGKGAQYGHVMQAVMSGSQCAVTNPPADAKDGHIEA